MKQCTMNCGAHRDDRRTEEERRRTCTDCIEVPEPEATLPLQIGGKVYDLPVPVFDHILMLQLWVERLLGKPVEWRMLPPPSELRKDDDQR